VVEKHETDFSAFRTLFRCNDPCLAVSIHPAIVGADPCPSWTRPSVRCDLGTARPWIAHRM